MTSFDLLAFTLYEVPPPPPIKGGTFFYCPWQEREPGKVIVCGWPRVGWATGTCFRTAKAYRRHWRKFHG